MLNIVDRTKPRLVSKSNTPVHVVATVVTEPVLNKVEEFNRMAEAIRAKKALQKPKMPEYKKAQPPKVKFFLEVANEIKLKRLERKDPVALKPDTRPLEFRCNRKTGEAFIVTPTVHAICQFKWRYWIVDPTLRYEDQDEVLVVMKHVFNKGKRIANDDYLYRNRRRRDSISAMVWGTKEISFLIDTTTGTIITCELNGAYRKFNKSMFEGLVKSHKFDHSRLTFK